MEVVPRFLDDVCSPALTYLTFHITAALCYRRRGETRES